MIFRFVILLVLVQSCVSSSMIDDARPVGKGNRSIEGSLGRAVFTPRAPQVDPLAFFYASRDIGTFRASYIYGIGDKTNVGISLDLPIGLQFNMKHLLYTSNLKHLHAIKAEVYLPALYYTNDISGGGIPLVAFNPSYIYTYRHDDLLSWSVNTNFISIQTTNSLHYLPGIATGIHVGDEIRFSAGLSYYNNFSILGASRIQYISVEAGIKYDL